MKNILLLNGNPKRSSFCAHLAGIYEQGVLRHHEYRRFDLSRMDFDPNLHDGYDYIQELESCLFEFQEAVLWSDHIVIIAPIWWGGLPAKLKGLFDRSFLPDYAFKYEENNPLPVQLLKGKTSRIILTMDAPPEYAEEQARPVLEQLDKFTLEYCGVDRSRCCLFGSVIASSREVRRAWVKTVSELTASGE